MAAKEVSAKTIRIHAMLVFIVCTLFGLISFVRKAYFMGLCTVGMGAVIPLVTLVLMRNSSKIARALSDEVDQMNAVVGKSGCNEFPQRGILRDAPFSLPRAVCTFRQQGVL